jgi:IS1 family transposase
MNKLSNEKRAQIIMCLIEGNSIASTCRMTGAAKMTVLSLLGEVGEACQRFHDEHVRYVAPERVQCDEVWSYCYSKAKNVPERYRNVEGFGSIWTWTALDADSKLIITWLASNRSQEAADAFIADLKARTKLARLQITSDGYSAYIDAIAKAWPLHNDVDYAEEIKTYTTSTVPGTSPNSAASRYSPGRVKSVSRIPRLGQPLDEHISTAYMERWNLTLRMQNRRFTRLTNGFSKKLENHRHMLALTMVYYNFCRKHRSLGGKTPAMAAMLTDYVWTASDLLSLDMWFNQAAAA